MKPYAIRSPLDLRGQGLWGWWDFTDRSTLFVEEDFTTPVTTTLDEIGAVLDKSGNGRHLTQGTSTARALWVENLVNGYGAAGFGSVGAGAVDDYYDISNPGILNANWTIIVCTETTGVIRGILGAAANGWREFFDASRLYTGGKAAVANVYASSVGVTGSTWTVILANYSGHGKAMITFAGVDRSPTNNTVTDQSQTVNTALFGALTGPGSFYDGYIAEVIKGAGQANYEDLRRIMQNYIRPKYGLAI